MRVAYLVTHPIPYQLPVLAALARQPGLDLTVFFGSGRSLGRHGDPQFDRDVDWGTRPDEGLRHHVLPSLGPDWPPGMWRPLPAAILARLRGFDALWLHGYAHAGHLAAIAAARALGLRVLLRDEANLSTGAPGPLRRVAKTALMAGLAAGVDVFLAIGKRNRDYWLAHGIAPERVAAMPYGVDNAAFAEAAANAAPRRAALRERLGLMPGRPVALFVGTFLERKALDVLLAAQEALAPEDRPHLVLAGDGPGRGMVAAAAARLARGDVVPVGFQPPAALPAYYDLCDALALPSRHESWGLVVNEAMACGRAAVVSDRVGCGDDLIEDGVTGAVFPADRPAALAACLADVCRRPERWRAMGEAARVRIERYDVQAQVAGFMAGLRSLSRPVRPAPSA